MAARNRCRQPRHNSKMALCLVTSIIIPRAGMEGRPRLLIDKTLCPTTPSEYFPSWYLIGSWGRREKLRVRIKDTNNSPHGKFHRFLFPFYSKFSDLNFASYVLYNLPVLCHVSRTVSLGYLWYTREISIVKSYKVCFSFVLDYLDDGKTKKIEWGAV